MIEPDRFNLVVGWTAMAAGAFSGAGIGLFFHDDGWLGGYASFSYERLRREERILRESAWELCTLFDVNFRPSQMSVAELEQGLRGLAGRLYDAEVTAERQRRFRTRLRGIRRGEHLTETERKT